MHPHDVMGMFYLNAWGGRGRVCSYLTHSYSSWEDITVWENICGLDDLTLTHPPHVRLVSLGPAALQRNRLSLSWHRASCSGSSRDLHFTAVWGRHFNTCWVYSPLFFYNKQYDIVCLYCCGAGWFDPVVPQKHRCGGLTMGTDLGATAHLLWHFSWADKRVKQQWNSRHVQK